MVALHAGQSILVSSLSGILHGSEESIAMTNLSEDPTYLVAGLLLLAGAFVVALNVTQQGKYLVRAVVVLGLVLVLVAVDWFWITDNERIEQVVYGLRKAVQNSDVEGVLSHMAPNVQYLQGETALSEDATRALIQANLSQTQFDFVRLSDLQTSAGQQSRRGKAEFRVFTRGRSAMSAGVLDGLTTWSLGFQETGPGVWKVNRISPISMPQGILAQPSGLPPTDESVFGHNDGIGFPHLKGDGRRRGPQFPSRKGSGGFTKHNPEPG
jgi:ketosteroid isomerase-like protein